MDRFRSMTMAVTAVVAAAPRAPRALPSGGGGLVDQPVGRKRQELLERVGERHVREQSDRLLEAAAVEGLGADLAPDPLHLPRERVAEQRRRYLTAVVE